MYVIGGPHPRKSESQVLVERVIASGQRIVAGVEVMQEILHRYTAINRRDAILPAIQLVLEIADEVFSIEKRDVLRAAEIVMLPVALSARDAVHIAIMERHKIRSILSFDAAFDRWPGLTRVHQI